MSTRLSPLSRDRRRLRLESLERRELLAGNIQASVIGSKLVLTGDNLDNNLAVIALGAGRYAVAGVATTVNGNNGVFITPRPVAHLTANLNGGNDGLALSNNAQALFDIADSLFIDLEDQLGVDANTLQAAIDLATTVDDFSLSGSLTVAGGAGDDLVAVVGNIGGSVVVSLGTATAMGGNAFAMDGQSLAGGRGTVGGGISVVGDGQADIVSIAATQVRLSASIALGGGMNQFLLDNSTVGGGVSFVGGANNDNVTLRTSTVTGHVAVTLGNGDLNQAFLTSTDTQRLTLGSLSLTGGLGAETVLGALTVRNNASIWTGGGADAVILGAVVSGPTAVGGSLTIDTGDGHDNVTLQANVAHSLVLALGVGNDRLELLTSMIGHNATIDAGDGNDNMLIGSTNVGFFLYVFAGLGNDQVSLVGSDARAAYLFGGLGTDDVDVDAATLAAIDFLFRTEFEP